MQMPQWLPWVEQRRRPNVWGGLAAGLVSGLAATWTMTQFQCLMHKVQEARERKEVERKRALGLPPERYRERSGNAEDSDGGKPATAKAASAVAEKVFHRELDPRQEKVAGDAVHYAFGTLMGGAYGAVAEFQPEVTYGAGVPFAAGLWLMADEIGVPAARLSKPPHRIPASTHASALAAHMVYGLTAEGVRRALRRWI